MRGKISLWFSGWLAVQAAFGATRVFDATELLNSPLRTQLTLPGIMDQVSEIFDTPKEGRKHKKLFTHLGVRNWNWLDFPVITPYGTNITTIYQVFGVAAVGYKSDGFYVVGGIAGSGFGLSIPISVSNPSGDPSHESSYKFSDLFGPQFLDDIFFVYGGIEGIFQVEGWLADNKIYLPQNGVLADTAPLLYRGQYWEVDASVPFLGGFRAAMNNRDGFVLPANYSAEFHALGLVDFLFLKNAIAKEFPGRGITVGSKTAAQFALDYRVRGFKADTLYPDKSRPLLYDRDNLSHEIWMNTPDFVFQNGLFLGGQGALSFYASDWSAVQGNRSLRSGSLTGRFGFTSGIFYTGLALKGGSFDDLRLKSPKFGWMGQLELSLRPYLVLRGSVSQNDPDDLGTMFDLQDKTIVKSEFKFQMSF